MKNTNENQKSDWNRDPHTESGVTCVPLANEYLFRIHLEQLTSYDCEFAKNLTAENIKVDFQNGVLKLRIPRAVENEGNDFMGAPSRHVWRPTECPYPRAG